jgi:hypothetical protein
LGVFDRKETMMADAPEKIWLQRPCRDPENEWFGEITWCDSRENEDDTEYVRSDVAMAVTDRQGMVLKEFEMVTRDLKTALIRHRQSMFPGTDQAAVIERDFKTPNIQIEGLAVTSQNGGNAP